MPLSPGPLDVVHNGLLREGELGGIFSLPGVEGVVRDLRDRRLERFQDGGECDPVAPYFPRPPRQASCWLMPSDRAAYWTMLLLSGFRFLMLRIRQTIRR